MKTETEMRDEFVAYFKDLRAEARREGFSVEKGAEWRCFLSAAMDEGQAPKTAAGWKCPRFSAGGVA